MLRAQHTSHRQAIANEDQVDISGQTPRGLQRLPLMRLEVWREAGGFSPVTT
jgi:hypothetical protein